MTEVEHGARGWHGINKIPTHVNGAVLQRGAGKAAVALHAVVFVLGAQVPLLLRDAATQRCRVRGQTVHVLLRFGERRGRRRVIAETVLELARVSNVIRAAQRRAPVRGVSQRRVRKPFRLLVLLVFHSPVLKPNLYLTLGQIQQICHLHSSGATEITVKVKLLLQLHELRAGVSSSDTLGGRTRRALLITHLSTCERITSSQPLHIMHLINRKVPRLLSPLTLTIVSTCSGTVVALLFCILSGFLHPGEYLLSDGGCSIVASTTGWRLLLLG